MTLFEVKPSDARFYAERLRDFLPERIIDVHTHVWLARHRAPPGNEPVRSVTWPWRVAAEGPVEELLETYRLMLPGKRVTPVMFGNVLSRRDDEAGNNRYVAQAAARLEFPALLFALPCWSAEALERRVREGGFVGVKVYLTLAESYLPEKEIRIYDYLPPHYLEVLDRHGWLVMLHIPRDGRLRDPVNLAQMLEIEQRYPRAQIIVAHVGRAYCPEDVGNAFEVLAPAERLCFDIAANTNALVFRRALDAVGPRRLLFGSDLPITRMRMRRICEGGNYVNIVPRGLYGDVSADRHMREADGPEAERLTFFLYEEIAAFHRAADEAGLTRGDIEDVFHNNAARLLERARSGATQNV